MSLPQRFGTTLATVPDQVPYVAADPALVAVWRERLSDHARLRVGIAWSGNAAHMVDARRSIPAAAMAPLLRMPGVAFYLLQTELRPADFPVAAGLPGLHASGAESFAETAALAALMDLVITVDTSVAHLAAAIGRPTWVLLPYAADFRWLRDRSDSPWYPTMRLFRQTAAGDWASVIDAVIAELAVLAPG